MGICATNVTVRAKISRGISLGFGGVHTATGANAQRHLLWRRSGYLVSDKAIAVGELFGKTDIQNRPLARCRSQSRWHWANALRLISHLSAYARGLSGYQ
jgi:hypothetical protein